METKLYQYLKLRYSWFIVSIALLKRFYLIFGCVCGVIRFNSLYNLRRYHDPGIVLSFFSDMANGSPDGKIEDGAAHRHLQL